MKIPAFFLISVVMVLSACRTGKTVSLMGQQRPGTIIEQVTAQQQAKVDFSKPETWILGYFLPERLNRQPHAAWFVPEYDKYQYNEEVVRKLLDLDINDVSILIVMGTWCPDSRREVPRFMKILTAMDFPADKVKLLGVDNTKFIPVDNYESLNIQRVPTFIFYIKNIEAGRIIENPSTSLEQDMFNILTLKK